MWKGIVFGKVVFNPAQQFCGNKGGMYPMRDTVLHISRVMPHWEGWHLPSWLSSSSSPACTAWRAVPSCSAMPQASLLAKGSLPSPFLTLRGAYSHKLSQWLLQINWQRRGNVWAPPAMCELLTNSEGAQLATLVACGEASVFSCWADVPSCQLCFK